MVTRQIDFDEKTDRDLTAMAQEYGGDLGKALAELIESREGVESFLDECERAQLGSLQKQMRDSDRDFRAGNTVSWDEVKRRNQL